MSETRQTTLYRAIRADSISIKSIIPPSYQQPRVNRTPLSGSYAHIQYLNIFSTEASSIVDHAQACFCLCRLSIYVFVVVRLSVSSVVTYPSLSAALASPFVTRLVPAPAVPVYNTITYAYVNTPTHIHTHIHPHHPCPSQRYHSY